MARILRLISSTQKNIKPHDIDKGVDCEHKPLRDADGTPLLHLSTFGSIGRESHRKSSQSMQFDPEMAADLIDVLRANFGDSALRLNEHQNGSSAIALDEEQLLAAYRQDRDRFRMLIADDADASGDVVAIAHRRQQVAIFERLLEDDAYFDRVADKLPGTGNERVWQHFFEQNPWIFGVSLSGQLLTAWSNEKLEQLVRGHSAAGVGKRTDALLRTSGRIKSLVFAEIKTHRKPLVAEGKRPYRPGCWAPSKDLAGGVAQIQGTVQIAIDGIRDRLQSKAADGSEIPGDTTFLLRPRSYLIIGHLDSLRGEQGGVHPDKFRSFELFRRQLIEPEVLTFDELLARAQWMVSSDSSVPQSEARDPSVFDDE